MFMFFHTKSSCDCQQRRLQLTVVEVICILRVIDSFISNFTSFYSLAFTSILLSEVCEMAIRNHETSRAHETYIILRTCEVYFTHREYPKERINYHSQVHFCTQEIYYRNN